MNHISRPATSVVAFLFLLLVVPRAESVTPRTWRTTGVEGWTATDRESIAVSSEGEIQVALSASGADSLESFVVWDLLPDGNRVIAATGDDGAVFRIDAKGNATELFRLSQPEATALGRDTQGTLLIGGSPDGVVYRWNGDEIEQTAETGETYIWKILQHPDGGVLVATGDAGKVYRLRDGRSPELLLDPGAAHVTGIAVLDDGFVITTESPGRLIHLRRDGTSEVWFDGETAELRSPFSAADGSVYFVMNPENGVGAVFRRNPDGAVDAVWFATAGVLYSVAPGRDDVLWVTTGSESGSASVFRVKPGPPAEWAEVVTLSEPQIPAILVEDGEVTWVGTGGVGMVYRVQPGDAGYGVATSTVLDAGGMARWGALALESGPTSGSISFETRSGNTRDPDGSWNPWKSVAVDGDRGQIKSPEARFLQWRVTLSGSETRLGGVRVSYLPNNRPPQIASLSVSELGAPLTQSRPPGATALYQNLPGGVRVEFQTNTGNNSEGSASDAQAAWARRYRAVTWSVTDPHDDVLTHDIYIRALDDTAWKLLESEVTSSPWLWDSATVPDGWYAIRLVTSDKRSNPRGQALTATRTSDSFLVDNTPPRVTALRADGGRIEGRVEDDESTIKRLEVAIDRKPWYEDFPTDGISDMPKESFETVLEDLAPGEHVVIVRVFDQAGNPGSGRVSFTVP